MNDLSVIVARLQEQCTGFRKIGSLADMAAADQMPLLLPVAFVIPSGETAKENPLTGDSRQWVTITFSVYIGVSSRKDASGEHAMMDLYPLETQIRKALNVWNPNVSHSDPVRYVKGSPQGLADGMIWWASEYVFRVYE